MQKGNDIVIYHTPKLYAEIVADDEDIITASEDNETELLQPVQKTQNDVVSAKDKLDQLLD